MSKRYPINIWINEDRYEELKGAGLSDKSQTVLAGMRVLKLHCTEEQKNALLSLYSEAKYDSATTGSIELLPPRVKDRIFTLVIERKSIDVIGDYIYEVRGGV